MGWRTWSICGMMVSLAVWSVGCEKVSETLGQYWNQESADEEDDLLGIEVRPASGALDLNLAVGDRFPLLKTVEQTLTQQTPTGPTLSRSTLELLLAIEVEEIRDGNTRLGVQYHRVRYEQDIAGERFEYDSDAPPHALPAELQVYAGLIDNGFSFWIRPDNQIIELVGFNEFLARFVRMVPPDQQQTVVTRLAETSGEEGIANFVDESIGLLPTHSETGSGPVSVGDAWTRQREVARPVPLYISHNCTLRQLSDTTAEIDIAGSISTSTTYGPAAGDTQGAHVTVRGGHIIGSCTIDLHSGLPIKSHTQRNLEMSVQLADGTSFEQQKQVVTSIRAFPQEDSMPAAPAGFVETQQPAGGVVPTSHTEASAETPPTVGVQ